MINIIKFLILAALVLVGWQMPFRDRVGEYIPSLGVAPSRISILKSQSPALPPSVTGQPGARYSRAPLPPPAQNDRTWMWNRTSLDQTSKH